ncbi:glycoside hydrolase family 1 protein [Thermodesulfobacteriota bacterium]
MKKPLSLYTLGFILIITAWAPGCNGACEEEAAYTFPPGFLFGTATAGFQVDMGCPTLPAEVCDDRASDWYQFVTSPWTRLNPLNFLAGDDPSIVGPGHWELYETDHALAADELGNNAFRMSLEWSRIFPASTVGVEGYEALLAVADQAAIAHYHRIFDSLCARGLSPLVTLHHYTLPRWIHDAVQCQFDLENCTSRGWLDRDLILTEIAKYAGFAAHEFGGYVDLWATQNEPLAVLIPGFVMPTPMRTNPPGAILNVVAAKSVFMTMVEAHARMYDAVKAGDAVDADGDGSASEVGLVYAVVPAAPMDPENPVDQQAAADVFYLYNMIFLNGVGLGLLDENLDGNVVERPDLAGRFDFMGMNYKTRMRVEGVADACGEPMALLPSLSPFTTFNPLTLDISEVYPRGIAETAAFLYEAFGVPVYVTENNGQHVFAGDIEAEARYLVEQLSWLARAIEEGVDVRGYFYWSLFDNFEWNHGMTRPLGLYAVDPEDPLKRRIPRATVDVFAAICRPGAIPAELAAKYPIGME